MLHENIKKDTIGSALSRNCTTVYGIPGLATSSRWCGTFDCSSVVAFAVTMSSPL